MRDQVREQVGIHARTGEQADQAAESVRIVARVFERLPRGFQKDPMLRIHDFGFLGIHVEKRGVEPIRIFQNGAGFDEIRVVLWRRAVEQGSLQLLVLKKGHRLHSVVEIAPELRQVFGAWKAAGQTDDSNALGL